ncbi:alpha/beta fold hydrolase [Nocardia sp. NPDC059246]|uniref:alpha/beta fold hydrolase n=1 Tax=unclassified Nocardia TaxID=2637762 RepID=UPI0036C33792
MATQHLSLPDGTIAYELIGPSDGPLVVCVPGIGVNRADFRYLAPALADAGNRVAVKDIRGHGDSSADWPHYHPTAVGHDIAALIGHLGGPAVIVGHSFAAKSAGQVAVREPELVRGLVLVGAAVRHDKPGFVMGLATKLVTSNAWLWTMFLKSLYPGTKPADFAEYLADNKAKLRRKGHLAALSALTGSLPADPALELSGIAAPTLVVMGTNDGDLADPAAEARRIADEVSGPSRVTMSDGSGHYPHTDNPEFTAHAILTFLKEL